MDAFFKDREATIDKKNRLRAEMRAAAAAAGPRQMDPRQQQYEQQQYEQQQYAHQRQGMPDAASAPQRPLRPHPPDQPTGDTGRLARHQAKQQRHRERAAQRRQGFMGDEMQREATAEQLALRETLEAERNARRMLEEQLTMQEQRSAQAHGLPERSALRRTR